MNVATLGDLLVDVIVRIDGPIALDTDTFGEISIMAGGQAANVAAWVSQLGHDASLICARCADRSGALIESELASRDVKLVGPTVRGRTGTVVSLAQADGTRSMLTDRGSSFALEPEALDPGWIEGSRWLHISGYALEREPLRAAALRAAAVARACECKVSVDLAFASVVEQIGPEGTLHFLHEMQPSLVLANEAEQAAIGLDLESDAFPSETWVLKRGAYGCTVHSQGSRRAYDALPATVVDATGAGDAFAGGFLVGGVDAALAAAARCVSKIGAMP